MAVKYPRPIDYRTRHQWGATFDATQRPPMVLPAPELWVHHTVTNPTADPDSDMRQVEAIDIGRFGYPSYSWVIHPTGVVLEGMNIRIGAHTLNHNSRSFGISFIGNFENAYPTDMALQSFVELCQMLISRVWVAKSIPSGGHRDVYPTACPGANLYPLIPDLRNRINASPHPGPPPIPSEDSMVRLQRPDKDGTVYIVSDRPSRFPVPDPYFLADFADRFKGQILPPTIGGPCIAIDTINGVKVEVVNPLFLSPIPLTE